jgi:hypothetical protein
MGNRAQRDACHLGDLLHVCCHGRALSYPTYLDKITGTFLCFSCENESFQRIF